MKGMTRREENRGAILSRLSYRLYEERVSGRNASQEGEIEGRKLKEKRHYFLKEGQNARVGNTF